MTARFHFGKPWKHNQSFHPNLSFLTCTIITLQLNIHNNTTKTNNKNYLLLFLSFYQQLVFASSAGNLIVILV